MIMQPSIRPFLSLGLSVAAIATVIGPFALVLTTPEVSMAQMQENTSMAQPLAKQLQGKPVVVDIYAEWCPGCKNIAPTLSQLKKEYQGKVYFVVLDVTDRDSTAQAEAKAKELGLTAFFDANKSQTSTVAIIDPGTGKVLKQFRNNPKTSDYTEVINAAIANLAKK
jgi:thiol-disulfide isomerase/thioredoxin